MRHLTFFFSPRTGRSTGANSNTKPRKTPVLKRGAAEAIMWTPENQEALAADFANIIMFMPGSSYRMVRRPEKTADSDRVTSIPRLTPADLSAKGRTIPMRTVYQTGYSQMRPSSNPTEAQNLALRQLTHESKESDSGQAVRGSLPCGSSLNL
ncbi:uncharacterized protein BDV17DRAFT_35976 [Aspergillus undulatus]|uniref:uncharacterized protein n=1 Tax=Aspergillus undulatus TaxID=1810928 RepID=UPI003CCE071E